MMKNIDNKGTLHRVEAAGMMKGLDIMAYKECLQELGQEQKRHKKKYCLQLSGELSCGKELDLFCEALWGRINTIV